MPDPASSGLFSPIEPYQTGMLKVGQGHEVYFEQCGNPDGLPVLFFHGGPASGCSPRHRQFFDPQRYRIVLFDQRGSGKSLPHGERNDNATGNLLADVRQLREHLNIDRSLLFGGSWGASLALACAAQEPDRALGLVLRGIFLTGQADMRWFFEHAGQLAPDAWAAFAGHVRQQEAFAVLQAYTEALDDPQRAGAACAAWIAWEIGLTSPGGAPKPAQADSAISTATIRKYQLQAAYLNRLCDLGEPALLEAAGISARIPTAIVHGRLDYVCRPVNALVVHKRMRSSRLRFIERAGHDPFTAEMAGALVEATNCFARDRHFDTLSAPWMTNES